MARQFSERWFYRIIEDHKDFLENGSWGIDVTMMPHDLSLWIVEMKGPIGSHFEGGIFKGTLQFHELYPYAPPTFNFLSSMFHPNISENGEPCLDQIYRMWSPCQSIWSLLATIQFLLAEENPNEPVNEIAAFCYWADRNQYYEMVKECVRKSLEDHREDEKCAGSQEMDSFNIKCAESFCKDMQSLKLDDETD